MAHIEIIRILLKHGADHRVKNEAGNTPLHVAVRALDTIKGDHVGHYDLLKILLDCGSDVNEPNEAGKTPFHELMKMGDLRAVELFIDHKADLHRLDATGKTVLHLAAGNGFLPVLNLILQKSCSPIEARTNAGLTALHLAVKRDHYPDCIKLLLEYGANLEARDNEGNTPLLYLLRMSESQQDFPDEDPLKKTTDLLLRLGADIRARNNDGDTVLAASLRFHPVRFAYLPRIIIKHLNIHDCRFQYEQMSGDKQLLGYYRVFQGDH